MSREQGASHRCEQAARRRHSGRPASGTRLQHRLQWAIPEPGAEAPVPPGSAGLSRAQKEGCPPGGLRRGRGRASSLDAEQMPCQLFLRPFCSMPTPLLQRLHSLGGGKGVGSPRRRARGIDNQSGASRRYAENCCRISGDRNAAISARVRRAIGRYTDPAAIAPITLSMTQ